MVVGEEVATTASCRSPAHWPWAPVLPPRLPTLRSNGLLRFSADFYIPLQTRPGVAYYASYLACLCIRLRFSGSGSAHSLSSILERQYLFATVTLNTARSGLEFKWCMSLYATANASQEDASDESRLLQPSDRGTPQDVRRIHSSYSERTMTRAMTECLEDMSRKS